ncbi:hypothetical protein [Lysobacter korlensis]|uniref:hypothetical protein n=1 Tax=Lysobacter korlensis TaxID=553636 RepID=UPI0036DDA68E
MAALVPTSRPAQASGSIVRCEAPGGRVIYTDRACETFGARPSPMSGELLKRIASDRPQSDMPDAALTFARSLDAPAPGRRSPTAGCARTPVQLARDLEGSLALRDLNRLAESYHWVGHTHRQAHPVLQRLDRLNRRPLQDVQFFDVQISPAAFREATSFRQGDGMSGLLQLSFGEGGAYEVVDFEVQRYAGCYFVRFRDGGHQA